MKTLSVGFLILIFSVATFAAPTATQIKRGKEVLSHFILPDQLNKLPTEKLNSMMAPATYQWLRARDILRITEDIKDIYYLNRKSLINSQFEGFASSTGSITLQKGEFIRVIQTHTSNDVNFSAKKDLSGVQGSYIDVVQITLIKLDQNFEPIGEVFYLIARDKLDRKIPSVEKFEGGFMARNPSLSFSRAGLGDVIVNAQDIKSGKLTIPAFTPAIITKMTRTRMNWTISNYNYVATIYLLKCPREFQAQNCEVQIKGVKSYADPIWAHYTMPENRRQLHFWGMTLVY